MTKAEFVAAVAAELDVPKTVAAETVEAFITVTTKLLKAGDKITFPGFGTFGVSERAARKGRNPQTGQELILDARRVVTWKYSPVLKKSVNASSSL